MLSRDEAEGDELQSAIAASLQRDTEPHLLQYIVSELNEPMEDGAEMTDEEKDRVSHRGDAYRKLAAHLKASNG